MKGFVGVTDNEWFAFLSQQLLLPKIARHSATQLADKNNNRGRSCRNCLTFLEAANELLIGITYNYWFAFLSQQPRD